MNGPLFETFVVSEIIKSYYNKGRKPPVYFYRDKDGNEIDLIIEENGILYPVEVKLTGNVELKSVRHFSKLDGIPDKKCGTGCVVSMSDELRYLDNKNYVVPIGLL